MGVAQTPGLWTLQPGDAGYDAACRAALKACGVDPDSFGSYSDRCSAIEKAGQRCDAQGVTASNLNDTNVNDFCTANSQSGHMAQNAIFQSRGRRNDECGNVPPTPFGDPRAGSSFGYSMSGAPCTDHFGSSDCKGTCHGEISIHVERQGWRDMGATRDQRLPMTGPAPSMEAQVRASARVHVDANRAQRTNGVSNDPARVNDLNNAQQRNAQRMTAGDPQAAAMANGSSTGPGTPGSASGPGPSDAVKDFAAECEVTKWKQMMQKMRADAINNSPLGQAAQAQFGRPFTELTQAQQQQVLAANSSQFGSPPPRPPATPPGLATPPAVGQRGDPPTMADCQAYQGNYLAWQTANNPPGSPPSTSSPGTMPGWEGRAPTGNPAATTTASGGTLGSGGSI